MGERKRIGEIEVKKKERKKVSYIGKVRDGEQTSVLKKEDHFLFLFFFR